MNPDEARRAIVAFLDQFIERGAEFDVTTLRDRLRNPAAAAEVAAHLPGPDATEREVFDGMRELMATEATTTASRIDHVRTADILDLLSWTERDSDGQTMDPAQDDDWREAVESLATDE